MEAKYLLQQAARHNSKILDQNKNTWQYTTIKTNKFTLKVPKTITRNGSRSTKNIINPLLGKK